MRQHHEHHDGTGYPDGLTGEEISAEARVVSVCGAWAAMRSDRPHRTARTPAGAVRELRRGAGTQFDPWIVDAFLAVLNRSEDLDLRQPDPGEPTWGLAERV